MSRHFSDFDSIFGIGLVVISHQRVEFSRVHSTLPEVAHATIIAASPLAC